VFVLPAVVGGGRGDVEEIRAAAWSLAREGWRVRCFALPTVPVPIAACEWADWPVRRVERRLGAAMGRAVTLSSQFGITAAPARAGAYGRAGPWASTVAALETAYGPEQVLHLSLEEFARNLPAEVQEVERWREGGRSRAQVRRRRSSRSWASAVARMRRLYRRFRSLDRSNLLVLVPTFRASRTYQREFPEAIQCGPLPPADPELSPRPGNPAARRRRGPARWIWYASPSTSDRLLDGLLDGARRAHRPLEIEVHGGRRMDRLRPDRAVRFVPSPPGSRRGWLRRFRSSDLRLVTGSRSLLEALAVGGPFLYFNGTTGTGPALRAHRPEKIRSLLAVGRQAGVSPRVLRDLGDFARGRRIAAIVTEALDDPEWAGSFPSDFPLGRFPPSFERADRLIGRIVGEWAATAESAREFADRTRRAGGPRPLRSNR